MLLTAFHGFCMALADAVPGVSGGTIAFILGFYERLLGALGALTGASGAPRRPALAYLAKLGLGWAAGMLLSAVVLAELLDGHIYALSSLFLGLTAASIPLIVRSEAQTLRAHRACCWCFPLGLLAVVGLAALRRSPLIGAAVQMTALNVPDCLYMILTGALAIGAMVLPGISGSSVLMIFGVYVPALRAVRRVLALDFSALPGLVILAFGFVIGAAVFARLVRRAMLRFRPQMLWAILGLMCGSLYAICLGPASMDLPPLSIASFRPAAFVLGAAVLLALEAISHALEQHGKPHT